jgi:hypothetical protein
MSKYDYPDPNKSSSKSPSGGSRLELWDMLSILTLLITVCIGVYFLLIYADPMSELNPLKPIDPMIPPTFTITPLQLEPTWTATATIPPTITDTPRWTITPYFSPTTVSLITPSATPTFTVTPKAPFSGTVTTIASTVFHPEASCNWLGVAGTVVDSKNSDVIGMVVRLVGTLNGKRVEMTQVSGVSTAYGKSGFEFFLGTVPISSNDTLFVQLLDLAGLPLSANVYIDTFNDCNKNLVLVRFKMNR